MLKLPGISKIEDYTYSVGKTNNDHVFLTVQYKQNDVIKFKILEFIPDQRCGSVDLLEHAIKEAMFDSRNGCTTFTYFKERMYIYLKVVIKRKNKDLNLNQFTGFVF